jgi:hypothetical protein
LRIYEIIWKSGYVEKLVVKHGVTTNEVEEVQVDPTPEGFDSYEAAAEFWETHDTTDYLNEFRTVEVISTLRVRHFEVEIEEDVAKILQDKAKQHGVSIGHLASDLLRRQLQVAA